MVFLNKAQVLLKAASLACGWLAVICLLECTAYGDLGGPPGATGQCQPVDYTQGSPPCYDKAGAPCTYGTSPSSCTESPNKTNCTCPKP